MLPEIGDRPRATSKEAVAYRLLRAIFEHPEPGEVARIAARTVVELTGWPGVGVFVAGADRQLRRTASSGPVTAELATHNLAFHTGRRQVLPGSLAGDSHRLANGRSAASIPLFWSGRRIGVLALESKEPWAFDEDDLDLAEDLADVIALSLDNALAQEQSQRRLRAQISLLQANQVIASTLELPGVLARIAEQMCLAVGATSAYICSYDRETQESVVLAEYYGTQASRKERVSDMGVVYHLPEDFPDIAFLERGEPHVDHVDDPHLPEPERVHLERYGAKSTLAIPLSVGGRTMAYAEIWESRQRRDFCQEEIGLCQGIAQQAAVALENARLFQKVTEQRSQLLALIESDLDGIIFAGTGGQLLLINSPAHELLSLDGRPEEWAGRSVRRLIRFLQKHSPGAAAAAKAELRRLRTDGDGRGEGHLALPGRSVHWRHVPVKDGEQTIGRLLLFRDVTEEVRLEQMRDDLTHTIVHDLRGPLTTISTSLSLLQAMEAPSGDTARRDEVLARAGEATETMVALVHDILDMSRLESGQLKLEPSAFSLSLLMKNQIDLLQDVARRRALQLTRQFPNSEPAAWGDMRLVERALQNLIGNAVKFTPAGGRIECSVRLYTPEPDKLLVSVTDNGLGIPAELRDRVFQKFTTGSNGQRGHGLGLYFCKMVAEAHGGRIWLERTSELGTTICFTVPIAGD